MRAVTLTGIKRSLDVAVQHCFEYRIRSVLLSCDFCAHTRANTADL